MHQTGGIGVQRWRMRLSRRMQSTEAQGWGIKARVPTSEWGTRAGVMDARTGSSEYSEGRGRRNTDGGGSFAS